MHNDARRLLRLARERAGLTQAALARATNCSVSTIRAYESEHTGRQRNPTRDQLESLLHGVYAARDEATAIMEGFGFSTSRTLYPADQFPDYHFTPLELQAFVERVPWPEFVVNTAVDIVAANRAAERLWGLTLAEARAGARSGAANLLAVAAHPAIADRIVNWSECVAVVVGTLKGHPERPESLQAPSRRFEDVIADFTAGESTRLRDLLDVWTTAPPLIPKVRWDYPVVWRDPEVGQIRFQSIVSTASEPAGLAFNDWIPEDAVSWSRFETLLQGALRK